MDESIYQRRGVWCVYVNISFIFIIFISLKGELHFRLMRLRRLGQRSLPMSLIYHARHYWVTIFLRLKDGVVFLPKQSKNLGPSYKDLDFWDCFGRLKFKL